MLRMGRDGAMAVRTQGSRTWSNENDCFRSELMVETDCSKANGRDKLY